MGKRSLSGLPLLGTLSTPGICVMAGTEHGSGTLILKSPARSDTYLLLRSHGPGLPGRGWEVVFLALRKEQHTRWGRPAHIRV